MTEKIAFVSGCDANYFPILMEWIHSIRRFDQAKDMDICILDAGLSADQVDVLSVHAVKIVNPDWPADIPPRKIRGREYLKGCVCRPFIPDIFPDYDIYIWMDADTWVQDWRSVAMYLEGARRGKLAITSQADRAFHTALRVKWLGPLPLKIRSFYVSNALIAYDHKMAKALMPHPVLNAGSFALRGDAPHWKRWQELVIQTIRKGKIFTAEQLSLGILTYLEHHRVEILPAYTQWMNLTTAPPLWDDETQQFVEPYLPHEPIGIMHLCGMDAERKDRTITHGLATTDGKSVQRSFRYPHFDGSKDQPDA